MKEVVILKIRYSDDSDILLIHLRDGKLIDSIDIAEGVILHLGEDGLPLEIEILDASKVVELGEISMEYPRTLGVIS